MLLAVSAVLAVARSAALAGPCTGACLGQGGVWQVPVGAGEVLRVAGQLDDLVTWHTGRA